MEDQIIIKGKVIKKGDILNSPETYKNVNMLCFAFPDSYKTPVTVFYRQNGLNDSLELTIKPWAIDPTERGRNFFFKLRDRVAETQGDTTRENKDMLYHSAVESLEIIKDDKLVKSIKDLDKQGLWKATEVMHRYAIEVGAYIADLIPEMKAIKEL